MIDKPVAHLLANILLSILLLSSSSFIHANAELVLTECPQEVVALTPFLQIMHDKTGLLQREDIEQLADSQWLPLQQATLLPRQFNSVSWYRLTIDNRSAKPCSLWFNLATALITDVQLYSSSANRDWLEQRAGSAYPFTEWAEYQRIPSLPLMLTAHNRISVYLRTSSREGFIVQPQLLSQQGLIKQRMADTFVDGMLAGVIVLLIAFSLSIAYLFRAHIALLHSASITLYALYIAVAEGYAFIYLWPQALEWNMQITLITETLIRVIVIGYVRIVLRVKEQPDAISVLISSVQLGLILLLLLRLLFPQEQWFIYGGAVSGLLTIVIALAIVASIYISVRYKLAVSLLGYVFAILFAAQHSILALFNLNLVELSPAQYSWLFISILPATLLLGYTLMSQIGLVWQREQSVLADIEQLKGVEQETLEQRVEMRTQQLRNALSNQNLLLARISHDLRSPLQHVIRDARLLQTNDGEVVRYGQSIQRAAQQQLELIDELLEFSRGELKQLELLVAPGYLFGFLREIEESGVFLAERNNNIFKSVIADDLPLLVNADFRRLRQVIINLLANAAKFTRQGEIVFAVNLIRHNKETGYADLQFNVSDNGIGMPKIERESLLQPFVRGENTTSYEGAGLGLYIVRQLLASMGSELLLESAEQKGVRCSFTLRLQLAAEQELEQVFIESYAASEEGHQRTVLIVDDVAITREMLAELLAGYDYNPLTCSSAAEALIMLREYPVDIIVTDQVMPGMNGWDLLRNVRKEWPQLAVLLYSAKPPQRPRDVAESLNFDDCLLKPACSAELLAKLKELLS